MQIIILTMIMDALKMYPAKALLGLFPSLRLCDKFWPSTSSLHASIAVLLVAPIDKSDKEVIERIIAQYFTGEEGRRG